MTETKLYETIIKTLPWVEKTPAVLYSNGRKSISVDSNIVKGSVARPFKVFVTSSAPDQEAVKQEMKTIRLHEGVAISDHHLDLGFVDLYRDVLDTPFSDLVPAKLAWEDFFIYKCRVRDMPTPYEAWADPFYVWRGVEEIYKSILRESSQRDGTVEKYKKMSKERRVKWVFDKLTIAKIAARITLFRHTVMEQSIKTHIPEALKLGVYDPCAGFGGRQEGCKNLGIPYEGYDVCPQLINHYGWTKRDALKTKVKTDKVVITSTPYSKLETWNAGPLSEDTMPDYTQDEWIDKITANVEAPVYGFFVRETTRPFVVVCGGNDTKPGLFRADQKLVIIRK